MERLGTEEAAEGNFSEEMAVKLNGEQNPPSGVCSQPRGGDQLGVFEDYRKSYCGCRTVKRG